MTINYRTTAIANQLTYNTKRLYAIQWLEEGGKFSVAPYADSVGLITIGVGFNLQASKVRRAVFVELGITEEGLTAKLKAYYLAANISRTDAQINISVKEWLGALNTYLSGIHRGQRDSDTQIQLNSIMSKYIPGMTFSFASGEQIKKVFHGTDGSGGLVQEYEKQVDRFIPGAPNSPERLAFLSMAYNGLLPYMTNFVKNVAAGDRAEAWYEIRYGANRGESRSAGIAKRRFIEAELFNLYDNPGTAVPADEAQKVYAMYTSHRTEILIYEQQYGVAPDGRSAQRNMIAEANHPAYTAIAAAPTLRNNLKPAADGFVAWVNTLLPVSVTQLVSENFNPAAILYLPNAGLLDASSLNGKGQGMDKNLLVGAVGKNQLSAGTGNDVLIGRDLGDSLSGDAGDDSLIGLDGDDVLIGGKGADTLVGGLGDDTYRWLAGDGDDKIIEQREESGLIDGSITFTISDVLTIAASGIFVETGVGSNVYKSPDGHLTLTGGATWQLRAPDGSVLVIGDETGTFQSGDFGITLKRTTAIPAAAPAGAGPLRAAADMQTLAQAALPAGWTAQNTILGDRADDHEHYDAWGNPLGPPTPGSSDRLSGSEENDKLVGLDGSDVIYGDAGDDLIFGADEIDVDQAIANGLSAVATGARGDWLTGGAGTDTLVGGAGDDALFGGTGSDSLIGGAGNDHINGDDAYVATNAAWTFSDPGTGNPFDVLAAPAVNHNPTPRSGDADVLYGGNGADWLYGGFGNDILFGDADNDTMSGGNAEDNLYGGDGDDSMTGGAGAPTNAYGDLQYQDGDDYLTGEGGNDFLQGELGDDTLLGGAGDDALWGDSHTYTLDSGATVNGDDLLDGGSGNDQLIGQGGDDVLFGGLGDDTLFGDADSTEEADQGDDWLDGEEGDDYLRGYGGDDVLAGGEGVDTLIGEKGNDALDGGEGNDALYGNEGDDTLDGGAGDDQLFGAEGDDRFDGGEGMDTLVGGDGDDALSGGDGNDLLGGEAGDDTMFGDAGDDQLQGGEGNDVLDGDVGNDVLLGEAGNDVLAGGDGDDTLAGGDGDDELSGGGGINALLGGDGNDTLRGGEHDMLDGGAGNDRYIVGALTSASDPDEEVQASAALAAGASDAVDDPADTGVHFSIQDGDGANTIEIVPNGDGGDLVVAAIDDNGSDYLIRVGAVEVIVQGGLLQSVLSGLEYGTTVLGTRGEIMDLAPALHITGAGNADDIMGGAQHDSIDGGGGNDLIAGRGGDDVIAGGDGNDTLDGEGGNDTLLGGEGSDTYRFKRGDGSDSIDNSDAASATAIDRVVLDGSILAGDVLVGRSGADLILDFGSADTITVLDYFAPGGARRIDSLEFADGTAWNSAAIEQRIAVSSGTNGNDTLGGTDRADVMHGLEGNDWLRGEGGDDQLFGDAGNDSVIGGAGNDLLSGGDGSDHLAGESGNDTLDGGAGNDDLYGDAGDDSYRFGFGSGIDVVNDSTGADTLVMGPGVAPSNVVLERDWDDSVWLKLRNNNGTLTGDKIDLQHLFAWDDGYGRIEQVTFDDGTLWSAASIKQALSDAALNQDNNSFTGYGQADLIDGLGGNDTLRGVDGDDTLYGAAGDDSLEGGNGDDLLGGGSGNDVLLGDNGSDNYLFGRGDGNDTIRESNVTGTSVDTVTMGAGIAPADVALYRQGQSLIVLIRNSSDQLTVAAHFDNGSDHAVEQIVFADTTVWDGAAIAARVIPEGAVDAFLGTAGNDSYSVDNVLDTITEGVGQGTDSVTSSVSYGLPDNVENLTLTGPLNSNGYGNDLSNVITGNAQNNILQGGLHYFGNNDTLIGGLGDDTYISFNSGDTIIEAAGGGSDTLVTYGTSGSFYTMPDNVENLVFSSGYIYRTTIQGNALDNDITTDSSRIDDIYDGGLGADTYRVNRSSIVYVDNLNDRIIPNIGSALSIQVFSSIDWTLAEGHALTLVEGSAATRGTGNAGYNILKGNSLANVLSGMGGADILYSGAVNTNGSGDTLIGGAGDDTYYLNKDRYYSVGNIPTREWNDVASSVIVEAAGEGTDTIHTIYDNIVLPDNVENVVLDAFYASGIVSYSRTATGNSLDNRLTGNAGANVLDGAGGADTLDGGEGDDSYGVDNAGDVIVDAGGVDTVRAAIDYVLADNLENLVLLGAGASSGTGNGGDNTLDGAASTGANVLAGGAGNDRYIVGLGDSVVEAAGAGEDTIVSELSLTLAQFSNVEHLALIGDNAVSATGDSGNNTLDGAANFAANVLRGGAGDDTYRAGSNDVIVEAAGEGTDTVIAVDSVYTLSANLENLVLLGYVTSGTGNALDNVITGAAYASNTLDGGAGADRLIGHGGNDTYVIDQAGDVIENEIGGSDTVVSAIAYTLGAALENLMLSGNSAIDGRGNAGANILQGNAGNNLLTGGEGADNYRFGPGGGQDRIDNSSGDYASAIDTVELADDVTPAMVTVFKSGSDLVIDIGTGDTLTVLSYFAAGGARKIDQLRFAGGTVWNQAYLDANAATPVNGSAGADSLGGTAAADLIFGLGGNDTLTGLGANDRLFGGDGNDSLDGGAGNDTLFGGAGNDVLEGGSGSDALSGGSGDDTYLIDVAGDSVTERAGEGTDTVRSAVSHILLAEIENLTLTGTAANGTGNDLDNILLGNASANQLAGGLGNDLLTGANGSDTYFFNLGDGADRIDNTASDAATSTDVLRFGADIDAANLLLYQDGNDLQLRVNASDRVTVINYFAAGGAQKIDQVAFGDGAAWNQAAIESRVGLVINGSAGADSLAGGAGNDILYGLAGDDTLDGMTGGDAMHGGSGDDTYIVDAAGDRVNEEVGEGNDLVRSAVNFTLGVNLEKLLLTGTALEGRGNDLSNWIKGNSSDNMLDGGAGADTLVGGWGDDRYYVDDAGDVLVEQANAGYDSVFATVTTTLGAGFESLALLGEASIDGYGNAGQNTIGGNNAANLINGGGGDDYLYGQGGADTYVLQADFGKAMISDRSMLEGEINTIVMQGVAPSELVLLHSGADLLVRAGANELRLGNWFDDVQATAYCLQFDNGDVWDSAAIASRAVAVTPSAGDDDLWGSAAADHLEGLAGNDVLTGFDGDDTLTGGAGYDYLYGGAGSDSYVFAPGHGTDWIADVDGELETIVLHGVLPSQVAVWRDQEQLWIGTPGTGDRIALTWWFDGSPESRNKVLAFDNGVTWDSAAIDSRIVLAVATAGDDGLLGTAGNDSLSGLGGDDTLTGLEGADTLRGGAGNDTLDGGAGADVLDGGDGEDYYAYNLGDGIDTIIDTALAGQINTVTIDSALDPDQVLATRSGNDLLLAFSAQDRLRIAGYFSAGLAFQFLIGDGRAWGTEEIAELVAAGTPGGTAGNDSLTGGTGDDSLSGLGGNDTLSGLDGNDTLDGGEGNDSMIGGAGTDALIGGPGDDIYVMDGSADTITEAAGGGTDLVQASVAFTVAGLANVENLTLTGTSAISATGNAAANVLIGNSAANTLTGGDGNDTLDGAAGTDTLVGGLGNDTYVMDGSSDVITEAAGAGSDLVQASVTFTLNTTALANVEALQLSGAGNINATGNSGNNLVIGNSGNNTVSGLAGRDILQGAAGVDTLTDTAGNNLLDGGAGNDILTGASGNELFIGGLGDDTVTTSSGADIIAFNRGDGKDALNASTGKDNTLSLGKGIAYADLSFQKTGTDLTLLTGSGEQVTFKNWYAAAANHSVANLQIVIEGGGDYVAGSTNAINNKKITTFNFDALVTDFDQALAANAQLGSWALSSKLMTRFLTGSDSAAIGGDLAYQYARTGNLGALSMVPVDSILAAASFGTGAQALQSAGVLQDASARLI